MSDSLFDWADECTADVSAALSEILNPLTAGTLALNPDRGDPDIPQTPLQLHIEIYDGGTAQWYEQRLYVQPGTVRGRERARFEFSDFQYVIQDFYFPSRLTWSEGAVKGQRIRVLNESRTRYLFKGQVDIAKPVAFHVKPDNSDKRRIGVKCLNEMGLFRRGLVAEIVYGPTTEGAMLKDLTERYLPELDASGINPAIGQPIDKKTIDHQHLFQLYDEVLKGNPELGFFLDISQDPSKIYLDERGSVDIMLPTELTDANIYQFCRPGDHWITTTGKTRRNKIRLRCPQLYNVGTVDVEKGTKIIYGTGTKWKDKVPAGARVRLVGSPHSYTVEKVNATPDDEPPISAYQDLYITSEMQDEDGAGLGYEIIGDEREIYSENSDDIDRQAAASGQMGPHAGVNEVLIIESTPLTDDEAQRLADIALRTDAIEGEFNTHSRLFNPPGLRAGRTLRHNMPLRDVQGDIPIQEIEWTAALGYAPPIGGVSEAPIQYKISFTDRGLMTESVFLQLMLAQRRSRVRDQAKLTAWKNLNERTLVDDCLRATQGEEMDETSEMSITVVADDVSGVTGPWYPAPLGPGQQGFVPCDPEDASTYNFPT